MNFCRLFVLIVFSCDFFSCSNDDGSSSDPGGDAGADAGDEASCSEGDTFDLSQCPDSYAGSSCTAYVDGDVAISGDGWSWFGAVKTVQEGIDLAHCGAIQGETCDLWQVWVRQGSYFVHGGCDEHSVRLRPQVELYGGFAGDETSLDQRDWQDNVTILDGRDGVSGDAHVYHVVRGADDAVIDGFVIREGQANNPEDWNDSGGGMYNEDVSPTVRNCTFTRNEAILVGGGVFNYGLTEDIATTFINCTFLENTGDQCGGLYSGYDASTIEDCRFESNLATSEGAGGGLCAEEGAIELTNCIFTENESPVGSAGGAYLAYGPHLVSDCEFIDNSAGYYAGGLYTYYSNVVVGSSVFQGNVSEVNAGGLFVSNGSPIISDSTFIDNATLSSGGAIWIAGSDETVIERCMFDGNSAEWAGGVHATYGTISVVESLFTGNSAKYNGGGLRFSDVSDSSVVENCVFTGNTAESGAAFYAWGEVIGVINCTFFENVAEYTAGAVYSFSDLLEITNSILWHNSPFEIGYFYLEIAPTVTYSVVEGSYPGEGNLDVDPQFVDAANRDLHLQASSPCIDAANGDLAPETDLDHNSRVDDTDTPNTGTGDPPYSDIGAYEFQPGKGEQP